MVESNNGVELFVKCLKDDLARTLLTKEEIEKACSLGVCVFSVRFPKFIVDHLSDKLLGLGDEEFEIWVFGELIKSMFGGHSERNPEDFMRNVLEAINVYLHRPEG